MTMLMFQCERCWRCCSDVRVSQRDARGASTDVSVQRLRASGQGSDGHQSDGHRHNRLRSAAHPRTRKSDNDDVSTIDGLRARPMNFRRSLPFPALANDAEQYQSVSHSDVETDCTLLRFTDTAGPRNECVQQHSSVIDHRKWQPAIAAWITPVSGLSPDGLQRRLVGRRTRDRTVTTLAKLFTNMSCLCHQAV